MSKTPRTDAAEHNIGSLVDPYYVVGATVACGLETELGEWKQRYENLLEETQTREKWGSRSNQFC